MKQSYVKTLLYSYKSLNKITRRVDDMVMEKAFNSMTNTSACSLQCEEIVNLTIQKATILEIKHCIDLVFSRLDNEEKSFVSSRYYRNGEERLLIEKYGRNYYRKQRKLLDVICKYFSWMGKDDAWFEKYCLNIPFIKIMYRSQLFDEAVKMKNPVARQRFYLENVA